MRLFAQQGQQQRQQMLCNEARALGSRVNAVRLNGAGQVVNTRVKHRQQRHVILGGDAAVHLVELVDIGLPVVGRKGNAGQQHLDVRRAQPAREDVEVALGHVEWKAAQPIVAAEFHNNDGRMQGEDPRQAVERVFGGVAAHPGIDDAVVISTRGQVMLKENRVRLARIESMAGGDAVSKADDQRLMRSRQRSA